MTHPDDTSAELTLPDSLLEGCANQLNDSPGVVPRGRAALTELLRSDPTLLGAAVAYGPADSEVRDRLADTAVRALKVADHWPTYREHVDIDTFQQQVNAAARQAGWHVVDLDGGWPGLDG